MQVPNHSMSSPAVLVRSILPFIERLPTNMILRRLAMTEAMKRSRGHIEKKYLFLIRNLFSSVVTSEQPKHMSS